jgi:hypothetical protein
MFEGIFIDAKVIGKFDKLQELQETRERNQKKKEYYQKLYNQERIHRKKNKIKYCCKTGERVSCLHYYTAKLT